MSPIPLGFLALSGASAAVQYWLSTFGGAGDDRGLSVAVDSAKNVYMFGETNSAGDSFLLVKYDSLGNVIWQRTFGGASSDRGLSMTVDSSNNIYVTGWTNSTGAGGTDFLIVKYDSAGTVTWQRVLGGATDEFGRSIKTDSSGNVYVAGNTDSTGAGGNDFLIAKYNSSGTIQWQRVLGGAGNDQANSIFIDSDSNVYALGHTVSTGAGSFDFLIAKYNSSGTIQWQRVLGGSGNEFGQSVTVDSSGSVYVLGGGTSHGFGADDLLLAKYNSSGTIQWQRVLGGASGDFGRSVAVDSSGDVYVFGNSSADFLIAKYNSSGTIQFQRTLGGANGEIGSSISLDSAGNLHLLGRTNSTGEGGNDFLFAKLPKDGSLTGTYVLDGVDIIYQSSSLTSATSTLTAATSTLTAATSTLTSSTSTLTNSTSFLTSHLKLIP